MSALDWFVVFAAIFVIMATMFGWMMWFWRRSLRSHETQIKEMVREMRRVIDEQASPSEDETEE